MTLSIEHKRALVDHLVEKLSRDPELPTGIGDLDAEEGFVKYECFHDIRKILIESVTFGPNGEYKLTPLEVIDMESAINSFLDIHYASMVDLPENYLLR